MRLRLGVCLSALAALAAGCASTGTPGTVQVLDAWARPAPEAGGTTAVYFRLLNSGDLPDRLIGGESLAAEAMELHQTMMDGDVMQMMPVAGIDLAPGETVDFEPGGFHVMLTGLTGALSPGDSVGLTLEFQEAGEIQVEAVVRQP
jgi:copper(I)-binding protein